MTIPKQRLLLPIVSLAMAASAAAQIVPTAGELSSPRQFSAAPSVSLTLQGFFPETPAPRDGAQVLLAFKDSDIKFSLASMMEILRDHRHEGWVLAAYPDPNTGRPLIGAGFSLDVPAAGHPQRDPLNPHPFIEPSSAELWQAAGLAPDRLQQILAQFDHNVAVWSPKTYRRKIIHHTLTPQLTEEEATQLLRISALQAIYNARAYCRGFDQLTGSQQMALSQLVFQMGTNLQQFVQFLDALNDNNNARELAQLNGYMESYPEHWKTVQYTLIDSQWARRYSSRAAAVIAMFDPEYSRGPNEAEQRIEATLRPPAPQRPRSHSAATLQVASYSKRSSRTHGKKAHSPQTKRKLT
jgi:GH24 family phage-related lysozyme (muramidase)